MKAHNDFIIHIPEKHKDNLTTDSGVKIFLDSRFSEKATANNVFEVVETPVTYSGKIAPGCMLLVDQIIVHSQDFNKWGREQNQYLVNEEKRLYKVPPSLIISYSFGPGKNFIGFQDNLICEKAVVEKSKTEKIGSVYIPESANKKTSNSTALQVFIANDELYKENISEGDYIFYKPFGAIDIKFNGVDYVWLKNRYVLGKKVNEVA